MSEPQGLSRKDTEHLFSELHKLKTLITNDQNTIQSQTKEITTLKQELERERLVKTLVNAPQNFRSEVQKRLQQIRTEVQLLSQNSKSNTTDDEKELSPSNVKVYYFCGRGRCEPIRMVLAAMNIKFEFVGVKTKEDILKIRSNKHCLYDQVPMLEMDGIGVVQSGAIMRYLGNRFNLYPSKNSEIAIVENVCEAANDFRGPFGPWQFHQDNDKVRSALKFDRYLPVWENYLNTNNDWRIISNRVTIADIAIYECLDYYVTVFGELDTKTFGSYPWLVKLYNNVGKMGRIQQWTEERKSYFSPSEQYRKEVNQTLDLNL